MLPVYQIVTRISILVSVTSNQSINFQLSHGKNWATNGQVTIAEEKHENEGLPKCQALDFWIHRILDAPLVGSSSLGWEGVGCSPGSDFPILRCRYLLLNPKG